MKNQIMKFVKLSVIAVLILSIVAGITACMLKDKQEEREAKIRWAEAADDTMYTEVKEMWKEYIEDEYDDKVSKVAIDIEIFSYIGPDYTVEVWYRTTDGEWKNKSYRDWFIPDKINEKLVEIISG